MAARDKGGENENTERRKGGGGRNGTRCTDSKGRERKGEKTQRKAGCDERDEKGQNIKMVRRGGPFIR